MSTHVLDTNVVVRLAAASAPEHPIVKSAIVNLAASGNALVIAPQVLVEFWVVATRPVEANGFGWDPAAAGPAIAKLRNQFPLLDETPAVFERWLSLVQGTGVRGKRAHDARIAALMLTHGISQILTLNPTDFTGFPGIVPVHPATAASR